MVGQTIIVVPCFNEAERLDTHSFLRFARSHADTTILFVDDGSRDATFDQLRSLHDAEPDRLHWLRLRENRGKAEAVRQGMLTALGIVTPDDQAILEGTIDSVHFAGAPPNSAGYWDADLATPLEAIVEFQRTLHRLSQVQMVIGSRMRLLGRDVRRNRGRAVLGRVFARAASPAVGLPIRDTQCGAKLFRVNDMTRQLFAEPFTARWIFDIELFARASLLTRNPLQLAASIYESPLDQWQEVAGSRLRRRDFARAAGELIRIWWRYRRLAMRGYDPQFDAAAAGPETSVLRAAG